jgi:hypothetical protein
VASSLVERLTGSYESPIERSGLGAVTSRLWRFGRAALPQEWWAQYGGLLGVLLVALPVLLLLAALLAALRDPRLMCSRAAGLLASPLLLAFATLAAIVLLDEWPAALFPRYANPMIPLFALFAAWAWMQARMGARALLALGAASSFLAALAWVYMAGAYYFTHIGASLGIHAAPPG